MCPWRFRRRWDLLGSCASRHPHVPGVRRPGQSVPGTNPACPTAAPPTPQIDTQSGILHADERDFKTAYRQAAPGGCCAALRCAVLLAPARSCCHAPSAGARASRPAPPPLLCAPRSYFFEAFEQLSSLNEPGAVTVLKYMLLCKVRRGAERRSTTQGRPPGTAAHPPASAPSRRSPPPPSPPPTHTAARLPPPARRSC